MRIAKLASYVVLLSSFASISAAPLSAQDKAALEPLKHYLGTWESEFQIESANAGNSPQTFNGTVTGKWSVGNGFLEQSGLYILNDQGKPLEIKTMMAFDKVSGQFDFYYFYSSGQAFKAKAKWDPDRKVMTSVRRDKTEGQTVEIVADFSKSNEESWRIVIKDQDDQVKLKITGKNKRKKSN